MESRSTAVAKKNVKILELLTNFSYFASFNHQQDGLMSAKTNDINKKLTELYEPYFEALCTQNNTEKRRRNPLLIKCPDHYFDKGNIRIMVIGRNTARWFKHNDAEDVEECQNLYETFYREKYDSDSGNEEQFKFIKDLNKEINNTSNVDNIVWTNVYKAPEIIKSSRNIPNDLQKRREWRKMHYKITHKEIDILDPQFVFFITGDSTQNDTDYIIPVFEKQNLHFTGIKEDNAMAMIVGIGSKLNFICLRLPDPKTKDEYTTKNVLEHTSTFVKNHQR